MNLKIKRLCICFFIAMTTHYSNLLTHSTFAMDSFINYDPAIKEDPAINSDYLKQNKSEQIKSEQDKSEQDKSLVNTNSSNDEYSIISQNRHKPPEFVIDTISSNNESNNESNNKSNVEHSIISQDKSGQYEPSVTSTSYMVGEYSIQNQNESERYKSEQTESEQDKSEQKKSEQNKSEQNKFEQNKSEQNKSEQNKFEQNKSEQDKSEQDKSEQDKSEQDKSQNKSEQDKSKQDKSEQNKSKQDKSEQNKDVVNTISSNVTISAESAIEKAIKDYQTSNGAKKLVDIISDEIEKILTSVGTDFTENMGEIHKNLKTIDETINGTKENRDMSMDQRLTKMVECLTEIKKRIDLIVKENVDFFSKSKLQKQINDTIDNLNKGNEREILINLKKRIETFIEAKSKTCGKLPELKSAVTDFLSNLTTKATFMTKEDISNFLKKIGIAHLQTKNAMDSFLKNEIQNDESLRETLTNQLEKLKLLHLNFILECKQEISSIFEKLDPLKIFEYVKGKTTINNHVKDQLTTIHITTKSLRNKLLNISNDIRLLADRIDAAIPLLLDKDKKPIFLSLQKNIKYLQEKNSELIKRSNDLFKASNTSRKQNILSLAERIDATIPFLLDKDKKPIFLSLQKDIKRLQEKNSKLIKKSNNLVKASETNKNIETDEKLDILINLGTLIDDLNNALNSELNKYQSEMSTMEYMLQDYNPKLETPGEEQSRLKNDITESINDYNEEISNAIEANQKNSFTFDSDFFDKEINNLRSKFFKFTNSIVSDNDYISSNLKYILELSADLKEYIENLKNIQKTYDDKMHSQSDEKQITENLEKRIAKKCEYLKEGLEKLEKTKLYLGPKLDLIDMLHAPNNDIPTHVNINEFLKNRKSLQKLISIIDQVTKPKNRIKEKLKQLEEAEILINNLEIEYINNNTNNIQPIQQLINKCNVAKKKTDCIAEKFPKINDFDGKDIWSSAPSIAENHKENIKKLNELVKTLNNFESLYRYYIPNPNSYSYLKYLVSNDEVDYTDKYKLENILKQIIDPKTVGLIEPEDIDQRLKDHILTARKKLNAVSNLINCKVNKKINAEKISPLYLKDEDRERELVSGVYLHNKQLFAFDAEGQDIKEFINNTISELNQELNNIITLIPLSIEESKILLKELKIPHCIDASTLEKKEFDNYSDETIDIILQLGEKINPLKEIAKQIRKSLENGSINIEKIKEINETNEIVESGIKNINSLRNLDSSENLNSLKNLCESIIEKTKKIVPFSEDEKADYIPKYYDSNGQRYYIPESYDLRCELPFILKNYTSSKPSSSIPSALNKGFYI